MVNEYKDLEEAHKIYTNMETSQEIKTLNNELDALKTKLDKQLKKEFSEISQYTKFKLSLLSFIDILEIKITNREITSIDAIRLLQESILKIK